MDPAPRNIGAPSAARLSPGGPARMSRRPAAQPRQERDGGMSRMIRLLAVTESLLAGLILWATLTAWSQGLAAGALIPALAVGACAVLSFYYCDLYDLAVTGTFLAFAMRLPQALAILLILW